MAVMVQAACSSAEPVSQPGGGRSASATPTIVIPERYALQQSLDFTITLTTTSVGGTFGRLDRKHSCERGDTSPHIAWEGVPGGNREPGACRGGPDVGRPRAGRRRVVGPLGGLLNSARGHGARGWPGGPRRARERRQTGHQRLRQRPVQWPLSHSTLGFFNRRGAPGTSRTITAEERPYYFRLYALDVPVELPSGADRDTLMESNRRPRTCGWRNWNQL